jgi:hypothetical protein
VEVGENGRLPGYAFITPACIGFSNRQTVQTDTNFMKIIFMRLYRLHNSAMCFLQE